MPRRNLDELGAMLKLTDRQIVDLVGIRLSLSREVEEAKREKGQPIVRLDIEQARLEQIARWAEEVGLNPGFAISVLYSIIGESCKVQLMQLQEAPPLLAFDEDEEARYQELKISLLKLTEAIAGEYEERYAFTHRVLHLYLKFEKAFIKHALIGLSDRRLAIDLGCAAGHKALRMIQETQGGFGHTIGYDISPAMIELAQKEALKKGVADRVSFLVRDLEEEGIPIGDASISFALMNMGTASDVKDLAGLLAEIKRVLIPGGRAVLSFYNREGLLYRAGFLPWSNGLAAGIDLKRNCLNVHGPKEKIYPIYARPYREEEVRQILTQSFQLLGLQTYPTISSILPNIIFEDQSVTEILTKIDERMIGESLGAYILASIEKPK